MNGKRIQLFLSESALNEGLEGDSMRLEGSQLSIAKGEKWLGGCALQVETAVHIMREVTELGDPKGLVGRVKTLAALEQMGGEYCEGSVLLGDAAYEAVEGFLAVDMKDAFPKDDSFGERHTETVPSMPPPPPGSAQGAVSAQEAGLEDPVGQYAALAELFLEK